MPQNIASGTNTYLNYGFETTEGTVAASFPRPFGHGAKISISRKNNMEKVYGMGNRNATANVAKKYEGTASVEFMLGAGNNAYTDGGASWLRAVLGGVPTDGGATPYTHTYVESNTPSVMSIAAGVELGTNDSVTALIGCRVKSATITAAVDSIAMVKLEFMYRTESHATSVIGSQVASDEEPLTFAQGVLTVNGTTVGIVQSIDLTVDNDSELVWGLGSRYSVAGTPKKRSYDVKMSVVYTDTTLLLQHFYGKSGSVAATDLAVLNPAGVALVLTFNNGAAGTSSRKIVLTFTDFYLNDHSLPLDPTEIVKEDVTGWALSCTSVVVSNNTATDVASP